MKCRYKESCGYEFCLEEECIDFEPQAETNADKIRDITDEELASFLLLKVSNEKCYGICLGSCTGNDCISGIVKWLKQPAEVE
jgi:hypothetical protein